MEILKEKQKRTRGNISSWVFTLIFLAWNALWISIWAHGNFGTPEAFSVVVISIITLFLGLVCWTEVYDSQSIKTIGFKIYHFKVWDKNKMEYVERWDYSRDLLRSSWIYNWNYKNWIWSSTIEDMRERWEGTEIKYIGKESKEDVMKEIMEWAKSKIAKDLEKENVKIIDLSEKDYFTVEEILSMVNPNNTDTE
jgi:hypothetical protein